MNPCTSALLATPIAEVAPAKMPDGTWRYSVNYTKQTPGRRELDLPAIVNELIGKPDLRIVILAGNSGEEYEGTRHSLAHRFGDHVLKNVKLTLDPGHTHRETVMVSYDDATARPWTHDFKTASPRDRTKDTEMFYAPDLEGVPVVFVRPIGDYNEVGDIGIALLDMLRIPLAQLLLIHDDLNVAEGELAFAGGAQEYQGNNAGFSLLRNLTYGLFEPLLERWRETYGLSREESQAILRAWRDKADIRDERYLGNRSFWINHAFRDLNVISGGLIKNPAVKASVTEKQAEPLRNQIQTLREQVRALKGSRPELMDELNNPATSNERKKALKTEMQRLTEPLETRIKALEAEIGEAPSEMAKALRARIASRITYTRLALGTDNGNVGDKSTFVLKPYPEHVFNDAFWARTLEQLKAWLRGTNQTTTAGRPAGG